MFSEILRENYMTDRCVRKDSTSCDPSRITRVRRSRVTMSGVHPHAPINQTVSFYAMALLYLCI